MELTTLNALMLSFGALGFGMVLLIAGGNWTVDAAVYIARKYGVSPLLVGFTIVAFGTSLPELIVSVNANINGLPGIAFGNVLGSNIANILLVLGATAIFTTLTVTSNALRRDLVAMIIATFLLLGLMLHGEFTRLTGALMLGLLVAYAAFQYWQMRKENAPAEAMDDITFKSMKSALIFLCVGLASIALGAEFLVRGAQVSATIMGVPSDVIGLSIIAFGTSLPELSTCLIAARRKETDLILGNIVGSNVFNILMIIGTTTLVKPVLMTADGISPQLTSLDIWVVLGISLLLTAILFVYRKINRLTGAVFVLSYVAYIFYIYALYLTKDIIHV